MDGIELIASERRRQRESEGWTDQHDDDHNCGELALAAAVYATPSEHRAHRGRTSVPYDWPWDAGWWKPTPVWPEGRIRELVKAGALIAAEIDRLQRLEP